MGEKDKGIHPFLKNISPKMNIIGSLQHFKHFPAATALVWLIDSFLCRLLNAKAILHEKH